jgi:hypothetical protein
MSISLRPCVCPQHRETHSPCSAERQYVVYKNTRGCQNRVAIVAWSLGFLLTRRKPPIRLGCGPNGGSYSPLQLPDRPGGTVEQMEVD